MLDTPTKCSQIFKNDNQPPNDSLHTACRHRKEPATPPYGKANPFQHLNDLNLKDHDYELYLRLSSLAPKIAQRINQNVYLRAEPLTSEEMKLLRERKLKRLSKEETESMKSTSESDNENRDESPARSSAPSYYIPFIQHRHFAHE